jgi:DNA-3-methyladenine glycosylase II
VAEVQQPVRAGREAEHGTSHGSFLADGTRARERLALRRRSWKLLPMPMRLDTQADVDRAARLLAKQDPRLAAVLAVGGTPPLRRRPGGFAGLASIVTSQQLSTASAGAIWARLNAAFVPFDPARVRRARAATLARLGLSAAKIRTLKAIAAAIADGLDLDALAELPADDAHRALTAVHGIGPWTADIYLLFCLGNADAWPAGDLAVQEAIRLAFGLPHRPSAREAVVLAEPWRPRRGVAACMLWSYYRAVKRREAAPLLVAKG